jgi:hypothetical protein
MAADVTITDRITRQDFRNLAAFGVRIKVLLDLTHAKTVKPIHLDIELDFNNTKPPDTTTMLSQFKQKYTSTYAKLRLGQFDPRKKHLSAKYEAAAFGESVVKEASNARALEAALKSAKEGVMPKKMIEVKYS